MPGVELFVIQEIEATTAFASIRRLRNTVLLIALAGPAFRRRYRLGAGREADPSHRGPDRGSPRRLRAWGLCPYEVKVLSRDEFGYLSAVFNEMTRALRSRTDQLEHLTRTDELTGLFNRRHLDAALEAELARARRNARRRSAW